MVSFFALLTGVILAVMISLNGNLSAAYGVFPAAAIIHVVGSLAAFLACFLQKEKKPLWKYRPLWLYLGGALGVLVTAFNNMAYAYISMTSLVALGLLGQSAAALLIDGLGLFGMPKRPFRHAALPGLLLSITGILFMLDATIANAVPAVVVSLLAGVCVVLSRTLNARLAEKTGALRASLVNHLVGLPITVVLAFGALLRAGAAPARAALPPWVYLGGVLGVTVVLLCNITVLRIAAFRLTLLTFTGQMLAGILLDVLFANGALDATFSGGLFVACGVLLSMLMERRAQARAESERLYRANIAATEEAHRQAIMKRYGPNGGRPRHP